MENKKKEKVGALIDCFLQFMEDYREDTINNTVTAVLEKLQAKKMPPKLFYNLDEVESITGISRLALKGRIKRGTLEAVHDGNVILVTAQELNKLIDKLNAQLKQPAFKRVA